MLRVYQPRYAAIPYRRRSYYPRRKMKRLYKAARNLRSIRAAQKSFRNEFQALHPKGSAPSILTFGANYRAANERQKLSRRLFNYRGDGDYWSDFKKGGWFNKNEAMGSALRGLGSAVGSYLPGGSTLGNYAGGAVSKWLGFGDYTTPASGNQLMGDAQTPVTVNTSEDNTGDLYLSHTEFIGNVTASHTGAGASQFEQNTFELNPGLTATFPWLSQIAANFELYDFQGLMFQYKPNSGESGASSNNLGKIIMATQYDPDANKFLNSVEMQNYDYANSTKPSCGLVHGVETALSQQAVNMMYVRTQKQSTRDKIFTDIGKFIVATEGIPFSAAGTQILGELWVTYRIKLSRATLYSALLGLSIPFDNYTNTASATAAWPTPSANLVTASKSSGNWIVTQDTGLPRRGFLFVANNKIISGCYQITIQLYEAVAATALTWSAPVAVTNCSIVDKSDGTGDWYLLGNKTVAENSGTVTFIVDISNNNSTSASCYVRTTTDVPAGIIASVFITQVSCNVNNDLTKTF